MSTIDGVPGLSSSALAVDRLDAARALIAQAVDTGILPSAVLAVATSSEVVRCQAFGLEQMPCEGTDSIYMLASISKAITATAVMTMVDDGLLALSAPIARYVPEFGAAGKGGGDRVASADPHLGACR